jgi:hypothetical protein
MGIVLLGFCYSESAVGERSDANEFKEWSQEMLGEVFEYPMPGPPVTEVRYRV